MDVLKEQFVVANLKGVGAVVVMVRNKKHWEMEQVILTNYETSHQ